MVTFDRVTDQFCKWGPSCKFQFSVQILNIMHLRPRESSFFKNGPMYARKRDISAAFKREQEAVSRYYSSNNCAKIKARIRQHYLPIIFLVRILAALLQQTSFAPGSDFEKKTYRYFDKTAEINVLELWGPNFLHVKS